VVPIKDAEGKVIGERMDNLIHASANPEEGEREIKLWFKPNDLPPSMQAYDTEESDNYYYFNNGNLVLTHEQGSYCFLVPGEIAWKSDLDSLRLLAKGQTAPATLETVVAKYLINDKRRGIS